MRQEDFVAGSIDALLESALVVVDSRGDNDAEAMPGGVPLDEIDPVDDGVATVPGAVSGRRDSRCGRAGLAGPDLRVGLVVGARARAGPRATLN